MLGIIHAVGVAPSLLPTSSWLPLVLGDGGQLDLAGAQRFMTLVMRLYNEVLAGLNVDEAWVPAADDAAGCESFAAGFVAVAELDAEWVGHDDRWTFASWAAYLAGRLELVPSWTRAKFEADLREDVCAVISRDMGALVFGANESFANCACLRPAQAQAQFKSVPRGRKQRTGAVRIGKKI